MAENHQLNRPPGVVSHLELAEFEDLVVNRHLSLFIVHRLVACAIVGLSISQGQVCRITLRSITDIGTAVSYTHLTLPTNREV